MSTPPFAFRALFSYISNLHAASSGEQEAQTTLHEIMLHKPATHDRGHSFLIRQQKWPKPTEGSFLVCPLHVITFISESYDNYLILDLYYVRVMHLSLFFLYCIPSQLVFILPHVQILSRVWDHISVLCVFRSWPQDSQEENNTMLCVSQATCLLNVQLYACFENRYRFCCFMCICIYNWTERDEFMRHSVSLLKVRQNVDACQNALHNIPQKVTLFQNVP